jgi:predicted DNA-binding transcriptional regulator YafY
MSKREYILRYMLIIRRLRNKRQATFEEINSFLILESELQGYRLSISKRTFQRDLNEIRSLFNTDFHRSFNES